MTTTVVAGAGPPSRILTGAICATVVGSRLVVGALAAWTGFRPPAEKKFQKASARVKAIAVMVSLMSSLFLAFGLFGMAI
jgi:hypothetical protein